MARSLTGKFSANTTRLPSPSSNASTSANVTSLDSTLGPVQISVTSAGSAATKANRYSLGRDRA